ncbi:MAG TPA: nucleotidyltransferase family protein [Flavipsychrobacter sp.]|nr:nucleotidyltransferase family protein [Flavipsychrobacter sp.]
MKAMIFAAGLGTRLKPFTDHHPKALAEVNGKTLLEHSIKYLQRFGIEDVIVNVHHFADQIEEVIKENSGFGSWVTLSDERNEVLETGGGLKKAVSYFEGEENFVVINVDVLTNLDLGKMIETHLQTGGIATLAVMERNSSRQLLFDEHMVLCGWTNNNSGEQKIARESLSMKPFAFSGMQVISQEIFTMPFEGKFSMIDVYLHFAKTKIVKGYNHSGNIFIDVGKPESLEKAGYLFE